MAPFHGFGPGEPEPRLRAHRMSSVTTMALVVAMGVMFYEVRVERIWSRSG